MYMQGIYPALEGRGAAKLPQIKFHFLKCSPPALELTFNPRQAERYLEGICECPCRQSPPFSQQAPWFALTASLTPTPHQLVPTCPQKRATRCPLQAAETPPALPCA